MHSVLTCVLPHLLFCAGRLCDEDYSVCETYHRCSLLPVNKKSTVKLHQEWVAQLLSYLITKTNSVMPSWVLNDTTNQHASPA